MVEMDNNCSFAIVERKRKESQLDVGNKEDEHKHGEKVTKNKMGVSRLTTRLALARRSKFSYARTRTRLRRNAPNSRRGQLARLRSHSKSRRGQLYQ